MGKYVSETWIIETTEKELAGILNFAINSLNMVFVPNENIPKLVDKDLLCMALDSYMRGGTHKVPVSETIEVMIRKNILLPEPDPETGKYIQSGSTPSTVAWIKLNNLTEQFPPRLFSAMIKTKCKPWIIEKYYRDM
jgi:hypothetical protein